MAHGFLGTLRAGLQAVLWLHGAGHRMDTQGYRPALHLLRRRLNAPSTLDLPKEVGAVSLKKGTGAEL